MPVLITDTQRKVRVPVRALKAAAMDALRLLGRDGRELSILVTGDARMRTLNRKWRGIDATTDVLSFSAPDGAPAGAFGDIVISAPKAARQAQEGGHSLRDEMLFLLVHGMLHLAGYDHEDGPGLALMDRKQRWLMKKITYR